MFYNTVQSFLEGYHRRVIDRAAAAARDGAGLEEYDVAVLKLLFLIKWVSQEMPGNVDNIATLMADDLRANRAEVRERVQAALERLERENYITRNGECYLFLTDDEQEIARQIARTQVDAAKLTKKAAEIVFGQIFETPKITVGKNNFPVAEWLDETRVNNAGGLTLRVLARMDGGDAPSRDELILRSSRGEAIVLLSGEVDFYSCLMEAARIQQFASATIIANLPANQQDVIRAKQQERTALETKAQALIEEAVRRGEFYAGGSQVTITGTNSAKKLIEQCTAKLVDAVYTKLSYIDRNYDDDAQIRQILNGAAPALEGIEPNKRAIDDMRTFLGAQAMRAMSVSMDDLQKRYQAAPYGWRERDIAAVVAELIAAGEARVSYGGQVVDARDAKMTDCLRKLSMTQRAVVEMRVRASAGDMTRARRAIETLCRVHDLPTEEEPLAAACRSALQERLDGLNGLDQRGVQPATATTRALARWQTPRPSSKTCSPSAATPAICCAPSPRRKTPCATPARTWRTSTGSSPTCSASTTKPPTCSSASTKTAATLPPTRRRPKRSRTSNAFRAASSPMTRSPTSPPPCRRSRTRTQSCSRASARKSRRRSRISSPA